jgi:acetolactate synthase-1/2/3 large subunit
MSEASVPKQKIEFKKDKYASLQIPQNGGKIHPANLVKEISRLSPDRSIILGDAGGHMLWLHAYLSLNNGKNYQNPGSFGPMAANVNASIGVKYANPDRPVIVACGDGDYQMAGFELMTAVENNVPVIWIVFNNGEFNIIKVFQLRAKNKEVFNHFLNPDYVTYAKACGTNGYRVEKIEDFELAFKNAMASGKPAVIDVIVDPDVNPPFYAFDE